MAGSSTPRVEAVGFDGFGMRRLHCGPAQWHVFARGTRRLELFRDELDFECFLRCLAFSLRISGCELWAYALMSNHYHLTLFGDSDQLAAGMHTVNRLYARYHNQKYRLNGHVFDGPYQAYRIPTARLALWTVAYVFLNPVKGGLCPRPEDYRWSGYRRFVGLSSDEAGVDVHAASLIQRLDLPPQKAWERFYDCIRQQLQRPAAPTFGRPCMADVHRSQFEWMLEHAGEVAEGWATDDQMLLAALWARQCGIALRVIAKGLGGEDPGDLSRRLYRFKKRMSEDPSLERLSTIP